MALEIRSRRFGFAVLDGGRLLDWGVRYYPSGRSRIETALKRLAFLLKLYEPSLVIARGTRRTRDESSRQALHLLAAVRRHLEQRSVPISIADRCRMREYFARQGIHTKYEIANALAQEFTQLRDLLPRPRKTWEHERDLMIVFDAIATAIAVNGQGNPEPSEPCI
ncbi:MAG: hypothetical protein JO340_16060 [Acidobacteriaceae bacterium]|nr:hypothetical protein [Acidobacteriaceae bacterium]